MILDVAIFEKCFDFWGIDTLFNGARNEDIDNVLTNSCQHLLIGLLLTASFGCGDELIVLRGDNNGIDSHGVVAIVVFHRYLALCIGAEIGHHLPLAADARERNHQVVSQGERQRHVVVGLIIGITKHHTLVASTLIFCINTLNTAIDVGTLLVNGTENATAFRVEFIIGFGITNMGNSVARHGLQVGPSV